MRKSIPLTGITVVSVAAVLVLLAGACSREEIVYEKAPFALDQDLVGEILTLPELDLAIAPPGGWRTFDSVQLDGFRRMISGTDLNREFYPVFPLVAFADSGSGGMMYIAQIEETEADLASVAKRYNDFISSHLGSSAMSTSNYLLNDLRVYYCMMHSTEVVNYKLVGETLPGKLFLIEYIIGGRFFPAVQPSVSASLATLTRSSPAAADQ